MSYGGRPRPRRHCVRWGPSSSRPKMGHSTPAFRRMSIVAKRSPISATAELLFVFTCVIVHFFWLVNVCCCCARFSFSISSRDIGLENVSEMTHFCVEWDVKPELSQSINCKNRCIYNNSLTEKAKMKKIRDKFIKALKQPYWMLKANLQWAFSLFN